MKLTELGTFAVLALFVAGMTLQHNDQIKDNQRAADTLEQVRMKQENDKKADEMATKATIRHDGKKGTKTVFVSLDASSSFDGGNVADQVYFERYVPDKNKPICAEYDENCIPRMGRPCECLEIQLDECGDKMFEPLCAEYEENCNIDREDCRCLDYLEVLVEYVDDCEYQIIEHKNRENFLKAKMYNVTSVSNQVNSYEPDKSLSYSWEQLSGPKTDVKKYKDNSSMTLELGEGEYMFKCTVADAYGAKDAISHRVIVTKEPNNPPEANITGTVFRQNPNKKK